ncbi:Sugar phosphate isomerase/epimerase [Pseudarthrobacter equi]|uniref:Sugar phosphate isomerase/epimerase n=1 Tax=Pseudarthrobacter equi TaxID=728066 RepID=A0A1H1YNM1_9MICC|nr:TIM barrel protein [Pseudarthrobacter equi]SDT22696.1 Sugar phosphate isomerase/epimerase [Pseudarthrobacter equi]
MTLSPGMCSVTLRARDVDAVVRAAAASGLTGIEWGSDVHVDDIDAAAKARKATRAAGLRVMSLGSYYRAGSFANFEDVLSLAGGLGAPRIRIWAGDMGSAGATAAQWDAVVDDTRRIAGLAETRGQTLAFEYHGSTLADTPGSTLELLRRVDRPNVGTYWQPAVGLTDEQALESLHQVIGHLVGVHAFSWWPSTERLPLAARKGLWEAVTDVLNANGKNVDIMLEFVADDAPENVLTDSLCLKETMRTSGRVSRLSENAPTLDARP